MISGVRRSFGGVAAVDEVDLTVRPGTVHALIGPNGSGKTTLLNLVSGFYRLNGGSVHLGDRRIDGRGGAYIANCGVARTFQTPKLMYDKSVLFNVLVAADQTVGSTLVESFLRLPRGVRAHRAARQLALTSLAEVGLEHIADIPAGVIPHGMQRLVEIARGVALEPAFLLMDEPAAGLSPHEVEVLKAVTRGLAAAGVGVLLIEHNLPLVLEIADEITVLENGRRLAFGTPAEIAENDEVSRAYVGRGTARRAKAETS